MAVGGGGVDTPGANKRMNAKIAMLWDDSALRQCCRVENGKTCGNPHTQCLPFFPYTTPQCFYITAYNVSVSSVCSTVLSCMKIIIQTDTLPMVVSDVDHVERFRLAAIYQFMFSNLVGRQHRPTRSRSIGLCTDLKKGFQLTWYLSISGTARSIFPEGGKQKDPGVLRNGRPPVGSKNKTPVRSGGFASKSQRFSVKIIIEIYA